VASNQERPLRRYVVREVREAVVEAASSVEAINVAQDHGGWRTKDLWCSGDDVVRHMDLGPEFNPESVVPTN
jgi:hypothetical protein